MKTNLYLQIKAVVFDECMEVEGPLVLNVGSLPRNKSQSAPTTQGSNPHVFECKAIWTCKPPSKQSDDRFIISLTRPSKHSKSHHERKYAQLIIPFSWLPVNKCVELWFPMRLEGYKTWEYSPMALIKIHYDTKGAKMFNAPEALLTVAPAWPLSASVSKFFVHQQQQRQQQKLSPNSKRNQNVSMMTASVPPTLPPPQPINMMYPGNVILVPAYPPPQQQQQQQQQQQPVPQQQQPVPQQQQQPVPQQQQNRVQQQMPQMAYVGVPSPQIQPQMVPNYYYYCSPQPIAPQQMQMMPQFVPPQQQIPIQQQKPANVPQQQKNERAIPANVSPMPANPYADIPPTITQTAQANTNAQMQIQPNTNFQAVQQPVWAGGNMYPQIPMFQPPPEMNIYANDDDVPQITHHLIE